MCVCVCVCVCVCGGGAVDWGGGRGASDLGLNCLLLVTHPVVFHAYSQEVQ